MAVQIVLLQPARPRRTGAPWLRTVVAFLLFAGVLLPAAEADGAVRPVPLFGSAERRGDSVRLFPKWTGALDRFDRERRRGGKRFRKWYAFLDGLRGRDALSQMRAVNRRMNRLPYVEDRTNYYKPDYWASPGEFFDRGGDCEDYAVAKYLSLRALGFSRRSMRIVVLFDRRERIPHAVLIVYRDGKAYVLDNRDDRVLDARAIRHYVPIYSINEIAWWLHTRSRAPSSAYSRTKTGLRPARLKRRAR